MAGISNEEALKAIKTIEKTDLIKELRARTHLGLTECKKALEESQGDLEKALELLQKRGLKKIDDLVVPTEGVVRAVCLKNDSISGRGFIVEVNCQTDFGARSEIFQNFVNNILAEGLTSEAINSLLPLASNQLGEKIIVRRSAYFYPALDSVITIYNHLGDKIAVVLESFIPPDQQREPGVLQLLDNIAMQIAANKPLSLDRDNLPVDLIEKKVALYTEEVKSKPQDIQNKILAGKMNKWYSEVTLLEQEAIFLGDGVKETVRSQLNKLDASVKLHRFVRYERGESL